ncbi:MAG: MlaD family protein [Gallionella sp.]|jgi:phospholipid/cholesterol/gamma-HCH transport system substrate-binding protein
MPRIDSELQFAKVKIQSLRFILTATLILLALILTVAIKQDYFSQTTTIYFFSPNARGLNSGMSVKLSGLRVGNVAEITMEPNATVKVRVVIKSDYARLIGRDAKAKLVKESLVGDGVVEIDPGSSQARQIAQNDVVVFERGRDIAELAEELASQIQPILKDIKQITSSVNSPEGDIQQTIRNLNKTSASLVEVGEQARMLGRNGNAVLKTLNQAAPGLLHKADASLENIQITTTDIRKAVAASAEQIPPLVVEGRMAVRDGHDILDAVKQSWPVRNMLPKLDERPLLPDGYVDRQQP